MREDALQQPQTTTTPPRGRRNKVRWLIVVMCAVGTGIAYIDRANLGVAMPYVQEDLDLSPAIQGVLLSAFFWTYALFQLPASWLVDRVGPRAMYAGAAIWWSVFTAATVVARGAASLIGFRLLLGVGESPMQALNAKVVSRWFPRRERAFASSIFDTGSEFGSAISLPFVAALIALVGWRGSFIITGALGLAWGLAWIWLYRNPREHKWTTSAEVDYIESGGAHSTESEEGAARPHAVPWRHLFRHRTVWGMLFGYICRGVVIYFFITWYPEYLANAHGFNLLELGLYGAIPGLLAILADWGGGLFSDYLDRSNVRLSLARKIPLVGGMLGSATIGFAGFAHNDVLAMTLLSISFASAAFATGALWSLPADIAPAPGNVASIGGIQNLGSQIGDELMRRILGHWLPRGSQ